MAVEFRASSPRVEHYTGWQFFLFFGVQPTNQTSPRASHDSRPDLIEFWWNCNTFCAFERFQNFLHFFFLNSACQQGKPVERRVRENRRSAKMIWLAGRKTDYLCFDGLRSVKIDGCHGDGYWKARAQSDGWGFSRNWMAGWSTKAQGLPPNCK